VAKLREGTFVGTPLYVAPEMLESNMAGKFTDLWALGCIIYQFHVGRTPFQAKRQDLVFQNIKERNITFPKSMDKDA
jgi:3-phosphoinositide dependent protein kinase-1